MTHKRKPSPYPRRGATGDQTVAEAERAYDVAYAWWARLVSSDEYKSASAEFDRAYRAFESARVRLWALMPEIDAASAAAASAELALRRAIDARQEGLTVG